MDELVSQAQERITSNPWYKISWNFHLTDFLCRAIKVSILECLTAVSVLKSSKNNNNNNNDNKDNKKILERMAKDAFSSKYAAVKQAAKELLKSIS